MFKPFTWFNTSALPFQCLHGLQRRLPNFWLALFMVGPVGQNAPGSAGIAAKFHSYHCRLDSSRGAGPFQYHLEDTRTCSPGQRGCRISVSMGSHSQSFEQLPMCQSLEPCPCSRQMASSIQKTTCSLILDSGNQTRRLCKYRARYMPKWLSISLKKCYARMECPQFCSRKAH